MQPGRGRWEDDHGSRTAETATVNLEQWFANVANFHGVVDRTGQSDVKVSVGVAGNGGLFAYEPPAVRVSSGTNVIWEWTGAGGAHDVVAVDASFASELHIDPGTPFEVTFDRPTTVRYFCTPHRRFGMKGGIIVV